MDSSGLHRDIRRHPITYQRRGREKIFPPRFEFRILCIHGLDLKLELNTLLGVNSGWKVT